MILKKPYAFLIKHFKLIHLILALPIIYLAYKSINIVNFFNDYVNNNYSLTVNGELVPMFINAWMYISIILVIIAAIAVYLLFKYKEKPRKNYIAIIIYYLMLFILLTICHDILNVMQTDVIEASLARTYRDVSILLVIPQFYFCIITVLRGLGFNVKKFNFAHDLKELEISEKDSEEFEFVVGVEGYKAKRTLRRFVREFSYYIKENTFIFIALIFLTIVGIGTSIYLNKDKYEINYKLGEVFNYEYFTISVEDSIITNLSYNGTILSKDKHYLITKIRVKNNSSNAIKLKYNNFKIKNKDGFLYPTIDVASYFADYAIPYDGKKIAAASEGLYVLVYELKNEDIRDEYELKIYNGVSQKKDELKSKYFNIKLTPLVVEAKSEVKNVMISEKLDLTNSNIGETSLTINDYKITDKYTYQYERCYNNECNYYTDYVSVDYFNAGTGSTLLVMNYTLLLDKTSAYSTYTKSEKSFFNNFSSIRYKIGENEYITNPINKTPNNVNNVLVLQVSDQIKNASEIDFLITVRNKMYSVTLK